MVEKKIAWTPTLVILPIGLEMPVIKNTPRAVKYYDSVQKGIGALVKKGRKAGVRILAGTDMLPAGSLVERDCSIVRVRPEPEGCHCCCFNRGKSLLKLPRL